MRISPDGNGDQSVIRDIEHLTRHRNSRRAAIRYVENIITGHRIDGQRWGHWRRQINSNSLRRQQICCVTCQVIHRCGDRVCAVQRCQFSRGKGGTPGAIALYGCLMADAAD